MWQLTSIFSPAIRESIIAHASVGVANHAFRRLRASLRQSGMDVSLAYPALTPELASELCRHYQTVLVQRDWITWGGANRQHHIYDQSHRFPRNREAFCSCDILSLEHCFSSIQRRVNWFPVKIPAGALKLAVSDQIRSLPPSSIHNLPVLTPPQGSVLLDLMGKAIRGDIPVYFAAVPLKLIQPFSSDYDPRSHPVGRKAIRDVHERWKSQQFKNMVVYPQGNVFIMSDDYIVYYACLEGGPEYVPCWILGDCASAETCDVQGPIRKEDLRRILLGVVE